MNIASSGPNDPRMASLVDAIRASRAAVAEFRDAMRLVNDPDMHEAAAPVVETADSILAQHEQRVEPTIADDAANLRALFSHLPVPRADADLGPLPGLKALRGARGVLYQEFDEVLRSARALGWRPSEPGLPDIVGAESAKDQGLERMLRTLVARMEAVEHLLDRSVKPEGVPAPGRTTIQIALVQVFIKSMKIELALAKLESRVKATVDFSVLGRAVENIGELTTDFLATVRGIASKMTPALREASERLRPRVRRVATGFKTVVGKVASGLSRRPRHDDPDPSSVLSDSDGQRSGPPNGFDLEKAHQMIVAGRAPPSEWAPWIESLDFEKKILKSLAPLAGLSALQTLYLGGTQVSDLAPLAGLSALQTLYLNGTQVSDLAPLAGLSALQTLYLDGTQVSDLAPLAGLSALQTLYLSGTQVSDLAPLAGLSALQTLYLSGTQVSDLAPLAGLSALQTLSLDGTQVSDLAPLAGLSALQTLYLSGTQVSDLAPLAGLSALQTLYLGGTQVSDLAPLAGLSALQSLYLSGTQVSDLAPLAGLSALQSLYLSGTQVSDLAPLAGLENLESIWVESHAQRLRLAGTLGRRSNIIKVSPSTGSGAVE